MYFNRTIRNFQSMNRPVNRYFENRHLHTFGSELTNWNWQQHVNYSAPETDVLELDEQYLLEIALPGVTLDDVELKIEDNLLTMIAKRTPSLFEERAQYLQKELPCFLVREFYFEQEIIHDQIEARLDRGILFISIPKMEVATRIPVSVGTMDMHLPGLKTRKETVRSGKEVTIK